MAASSKVASAAASSVASTTASGDVLGNRGAAKQRYRFLTRIKSVLIGVGNIVLLALTYTCLIRAFAFQAGLIQEVAEKTIEYSFEGANATDSDLSAIGLQVFQTASGAGGILWLADMSDVRMASVDTGMSHIVGALSNSTLVFFMSHACTGKSTKFDGVLATQCDMSPDGSVQTCTEHCVGLSSPYANANEGPIEPIYDRAFTIEEFYRTKNSVGFGTTYTTERIVSVEQSDSESLSFTLDLELRSEQRSNAQSTYNIPWQDIIKWILMLNISLNVAGRLMTCPVLLRGVKIRSSRVLVKADLAGGLYTSPGRSLSMFLFTVVCGCQSYLFIDAAYYPHSLFSQFWIISNITSMASTLLTILLAGSEHRFFTTGSMLFIISAIARFLTMSISQENAQSEIRGLGQVLEKECSIFDAVRTPIGTVTCNIADGMGMSGLEIFYKVYFEPLLVSLFLLAAFELFIYILSSVKRSIVNARKSSLQKRSQVTSGGSNLSGSGNSKGRYRASASSTIPGVSDYDKAVLLANHGTSAFCRAWASPIWTILGKFTHASTSIEDDLVLYGPLLIRMNSFPIAVLASFVLGKKTVVEAIIFFKAYVGVLTADSKLASRRENGNGISSYVAEYDYAAMPTLINGAPLM